MNTTIQISMETKQKIKSFGLNGETYDDIINRIYEKATYQQLDEFLKESTNMISIDKAIKRAKKEWQ